MHGRCLYAKSYSKEICMIRKIPIYFLRIKILKLERDQKSIVTICLTPKQLIYRESTSMGINVHPEKVIINILASKSKNSYNLKYTCCNPLGQGLAKANDGSKKHPPFWVTIFFMLKNNANSDYYLFYFVITVLH